MEGRYRYMESAYGTSRGNTNMRTYARIKNNSNETVKIDLVKSDLLGRNTIIVHAEKNTGIYAISEKSYIELVSSGIAKQTTEKGFDGEIIFIADMNYIEEDRNIIEEEFKG